MRQLIGIARRFSPVLALMTVAALLMLQPPAHAADEMAMPPSPSAVSADGNAAGASHGRRPMTPDMPGTGEHQGTNGEIAHRVATAPAASMTDYETPPSSKTDTGQISDCVGCASPGSPSPSPMDCVAAGCLVLMVLLVGVGSVRPASRGRSWPLADKGVRSGLEAVVLRRWASPPRSLAELSISRT